jgi:hypothetical protein
MQMKLKINNRFSEELPCDADKRMRQVENACFTAILLKWHENAIKDTHNLHNNR